MIPLNCTLLSRLIEARFGSIFLLLDVWHERFGAYEDENTPNRSTIYRWLKGQWPGTMTTLLRLAGVLDIDPVCLIDLSKDNSDEVLAALDHSYRTRMWSPNSLGFLEEFIGLKSEWPPRRLSLDYFGREWHLQEFSHDLSLGRNFYPSFFLIGAPRENESCPQVFHFAYRHGARFVEQWVQYGYVIRQGLSVQLISIDGRVDNYDADRIEDPSVIETWFGAGATVFRVASLHSFSLEVRREKAAKSVQFSA